MRIYVAGLSVGCPAGMADAGVYACGILAGNCIGQRLHLSLFFINLNGSVFIKGDAGGIIPPVL